MNIFTKGSRRLAAALFCLATAISVAAQPAFLPIQTLTNGEVRVRLTVPSTTFARVEASTNLADWDGYLTAGAGSLTHTDVFAPYAPTRYYRAVTVTNAGTFAGDHISTTNGDVIIRQVNHAGFVMKWNGKMIYNDPVSGSFGGFPKADIIFIGHDHPDHFNLTTIAGVKSVNCLIVAPQIVYNQLGSLKAVTTMMANGDSTNLLGIDIQAVPAYDFDNQHPQGVGNGYVLTIGGKRIYMAGDTDDIPETRSLTDIEVAFLPMNSFTMTSAQAASVVKAFRPKIIYPYHYTDIINPNTFKNLMGPYSGVQVRLRNWY